MKKPEPAPPAKEEAKTSAAAGTDEPLKDEDKPE